MLIRSALTLAVLGSLFFGAAAQARGFDGPDGRLTLVAAPDTLVSADGRRFTLSVARR